ncbi:hypothetical protein L6452_02784 [Arctium lappa]|uniref:Uncharacterized protein n=1 Tax=Arctium lappa TaxID=4217 RepID=A0ACB9FLE2_ARCLA|nr:hypothetical protein L6452_02784 [Arctium lappa]
MDGSHDSVLVSKVPMLKPNEFDMWKIRIKQYILLTDYSMWDIIENGPSNEGEMGADGKRPPPKTDGERKMRQTEMKALSTLLLAIPNEYQHQFCNYADARILWNAMEKWFSGTKSTKRNQKAILKKQYENFMSTKNESMTQTFDRFNKMIGELATVGVKIDQDDVNRKFLRSLGEEWVMYTVSFRQNDNLEDKELDELYNDLRVFEAEVESKKKPSGYSHNAALLSSTADSSANTKSVSIAYGSKQDEPNDSVLEAFLASHAKSSLINDDLEQINVDDLEEMDIKWQMEMLTMRIKRFIKRTGRNNFAMRREDGAGFDKSKVECYKCYKLGHFARECRGGISQQHGSNNQQSMSTNYNRNPSQALVSQDGMGFDCSDQAEEAIQNQALMAEVSESSSTAIPTEVKSKLCSKACLETVKKYRDHDQSMCDDLKRLEKHRRDSNLIIVNFEEQIKAYQANELQHSYDQNYWKWEKKELEIKLEKAREECEKVRSEFEKAKLDIEKFSNASKAMDTLLKSQVHDKLKRGIGYNNTPPPYNNNYIPPTSDLLERQDKNDLPEGATEVDPLDTVVVEAESEEENKKDLKEIPLENHILTNERGGKPFVKSEKVEKSKSGEETVKSEKAETSRKGKEKNKFAKTKENTPRKSRSNLKNKKANKCVLIWVPKETKSVSTATSNSTANRNNAADSNTTADQVSTVNKVSTANEGNQQLKRKSIWHVDSCCSRHMTGNMSCLQNFKRFDGGRVAFGDNPEGGKISGKGKQHKTSYKSTEINSISSPIQLLHMDLFGPTNVMSIGKKTYCLVIVDDFSRFTWVYFLRTKDETSGLIKSFVLGIENQTNLRVKIIISDNGTEFKNSDLNNFCETKVIERQYSAPRTPQQNGVAERRNRTLIEAARSLLADSKLPITFWAEAVNTACYVQNRVLVVKSQGKTPYELFKKKKPFIGFFKPFECPWTILNTKSHLCKFESKAEDGFLVGYSSQSKAYRVFNSSSRIIHESDNVKCNENTPNPTGAGPDWLFDIDSLTNSLGFSDVQTSGTSSEEKQAQKPEFVLFPIPTVDLAEFCQQEQEDDSETKEYEPEQTEDEKGDEENKDDKEDAHPSGNTGPETSILSEDDTDKENSSIFGGSTPEKNDSNLNANINEEAAHQTRTQKNHPPQLVIGDINSPRITWHQSKIGGLKDLQSGLLSCFLSQIEPKKAYDAMKEPSWIEAMQEKLLQFELQNVWDLVDFPQGQRTIGTKWVFRNKKDERGIVIKNKARLVAQGYTQEEGIDYEEVFAPVARIEAIRLFLAYASFMQFRLFQMDVKSAFLYGKIDEEVYVCQPLGFENPTFPDKVYKLKKAVYGLHQAPRAWYDTLSTYLLENGFERGIIDKTLFIKRKKKDILLVQIYVYDIIFGSTKDYMCKEFEELMHKRFKMSSMGELTFFLGLQPASTPMETYKLITADLEGEDVDVHHYRSMIGSLMYLTASRPDIMFVVCVCARFQVRPKQSHFQAVKRIFRHLKGQPRLGLWYSHDSPFDLIAYSDSDLSGANLDRKSTSGGCQFLGARLVSWQCKKQTTVSTYTTETKYIAAASCCSQVLWIQNQMLDYGVSFLHTPIFIDNNSVISIVNNPVKHSKTKHIEIRYHFIRDCNEKKLIQVLKVHTSNIKSVFDRELNRNSA